MVGAGRILATTDAGTTWTRQYSGTAALDQVDFTDDMHGWAAGRDTLLRTTNGGATWTALKEPCQRELSAIHFVSPTLGYAVAAAPGDRARGRPPTRDARAAHVHVRPTAARCCAPPTAASPGPT